MFSPDLAPMDRPARRPARAHSAAEALMRVGRENVWTEEQLLDALRRVAARYGKISVQTYHQAAQEMDGIPAIGLFMGRRFETFNQAVAAAGLTPQEPKRSYSRRSVDEMLADLAFVRSGSLRRRVSTGRCGPRIRSGGWLRRS
jgi:Homing endonuclease associated repeat